MVGIKRIVSAETRERAEAKAEVCAKVMRNAGFIVNKAARRVMIDGHYTLSDSVTSAAFSLMDCGFKLPPIDFERRGAL